jgi:hypothetical protein
MSASSPVINIEAGEQYRQADVRASLRGLYSRRVRRQAIAVVSLVVACALAALLLVAFLDYGWGLARAARTGGLFLVLLSSLFLLARLFTAFLRRRTLTELAREIERAAGSCRNALVTFSESVEGAGIEEGTAIASEPYMLARLERQARLEFSLLDEETVAPRKGAVRGMSALLSLLLLLASLRVFAPVAFAREVRRVLWPIADDASLGQSLNSNGATNANGPEAVISVDELRVRVVPPIYSGLGVEEVSADAPLRVLAGSQVEVELHATGAATGATLAFKDSTNSMRLLGAGRFGGAFTADASGAFEARVRVEDESRAPAPIVRAVEVYNDAQPEARITEPASDQLLRSVPSSPVALRWTARDDLGLAAVTLKYIKSRGEGDSAKFTSGELGPGDVRRASVREWQGQGALDLRRLDMQPGDTLVFWLEARDRRPLSSAGANNTGRSASLAIAVAAPELAKLSLSDLKPNEINRFLLSERAIIIHTEKLHSERARLQADEFKRRAGDIASEQREFKNSFNDYIHIEGAGEDEGAMAGGGATSPSSVEEQVRAAENERIEPHFHGIPEPPAGSSTSVKEMTYAIRAMWDAEDALTNADTALALKHEREALTRLKRAQASVRYVPPILPQSKPIDLKRRYAGELDEIKTRLEKLSRRPSSPSSISVRAALADAYAALGDLQETLNVPASVRSGAVGRARARARQAADRLLSNTGGDHAATVAEAAGQLRVVEMELARVETGGGSDVYATRIAKPLALLTQAAANLFAIAESRTRAAGNDAEQLLPTDDARAADYFRRLAGGVGDAKPSPRGSGNSLSVEEKRR